MIIPIFNISIELATLLKLFLPFILGLAFLSIIFALLPVGSLPSGTENAISWVVGTLVDFDFILPVSTIFTIFALVLLIETIKLSVKAIAYIVRLLRFEKVD